MKRKLWEMGPEMEMPSKLGVLQEDLTEDEIELTELRKERAEVKEGRCDECGAFDVLSRRGESFMCPACMRMLLAKRTSKKR